MGKPSKRVLKQRIPELYKIACAHGYTASEATFRQNKPYRTEEPTDEIDYMTCNFRSQIFLIEA